MPKSNNKTESNGNGSKAMSVGLLSTFSAGVSAFALFWGPVNHIYNGVKNKSPPDRIVAAVTESFKDGATKNWQLHAVTGGSNVARPLLNRKRWNPQLFHLKKFLRVTLV